MAAGEVPTITSSAAQDSDLDLDPAAFLESVRELSEKSDREDVERFRQLEEKVHREREERATRRAERARSISPEKPNTTSSPSSRTIISRGTTNASLVSSPPVTMTPPSSSATMEPGKTITTTSPKLDADVPDFKGFGSIKRSSAQVSSRSSVRSSSSEEKPAQPRTEPAATGLARSGTTITTTEPAKQNATGLARSGTLTWNRRPQSQIGGSRPQSQLSSSRPQSMAASAASETRPIHSRNESVDKPAPSRDQIAASLGTRDPSWFKQTSDRGVGSAAYRKSQVEDQPDNAPAPTSTVRRGLPGLSRELPAEPESQNSPPSSASLRSDSRSRDGSVRGSIVSAGSRTSTMSASSNSKPDLKALIAEDEGQRKVSPSYNNPSDGTSTASTESVSIARSVTMSSSQARLAGVERPVSPTKGMGGFVQSAMMKRSDSHNKRWSAQPGANVSRSNSIVSHRSRLGGLQGSYSMPKLEPAIATAEPTKDSSSRPTSSSNELIKLATEQDSDGFVKPALPNQSHGHSRSKSVASNYSTNDDTPSSPGSPSKRFSPAKSSWLESSLTKPESPKPIPAKNSQPSWMADLASRKAQRGSVDLGTPLSADGVSSRPSSPLKEASFGQSILKRAESTDSPKTATATPETPTNTLRSFKLANRLEQLPAAVAISPQPEAEKKLDAPISFTPASKAISLQEIPKAEPEDASKQSTPPITSQEKPEMPPPQAQSTKPRSPLIPSQPATPEPGLVRQRSKTFLNESPAAPLSDKPRPDAAPRMPSDFRNQLKSRPPPEPKSDQQPEFLAKFGALRKTQPEKFVAPDVLKNNILLGKSGLAQTGGPVKTVRRDELKEDLLAKKDEFKKAKEEGRDLPGAVHARKVSETKSPVAPSKPEALAKRELLGRSDSNRSAAFTATVDRAREGTPEALVRAKSLKSRNQPIKDKPSEVASPKPELLRQEPAKQTSLPTPAPTESKFEPLSKQISAPMVAEPKQIKETSKLASRFNPALANMLARGPPSQFPSRNELPVNAGAFSPPVTASSEPVAAGAPLQDVRKYRAKGPKRKKAGPKTDISASEEVPTTQAAEPSVDKAPLPSTGASLGGVAEPAAVKTSPELANRPNFSTLKASPAAGSVATVMATSLSKSLRPSSIGLKLKQDAVEPTMPLKLQSRNLPGSMGSPMKASLHQPEQEAAKSESAPAKSLAPPTITTSFTDQPAKSSPAAAIPEFKGFGAARASKPAQSAAAPDDDKENGGSLPSVKAATPSWARRASPIKNETPTQIQLSNKRDEKAAMRSAGLLAAQPGLGITVSKSGDSSPGPVSASAPPRPSKSSRVVSGQLAEASPNKGSALPRDPPAPEPSAPMTEAGRLLAKTFGIVPRYREALSMDTSAVLVNKEQREDAVKTLRRNVVIIFADGASKALAPREEYTLYDESVYVVTHSFINAKGIKACQGYIWAGDTAFETTLEAAHTCAKRISRENGSSPVQIVRQGHETAGFLHTLGGILITRQGAPESAPKKFMLCGRKHHGHIMLDELDNFAPESLCAGFVYLISHPVTLQETKLYLWKGSACSTEELSAARLAAMDLSETGEIIEVDGGAEFNSFLRLFGTNTTKASIAGPTELWRQKALAPTKFETRLFRVQQAPQRTGLMTAIWNRRPSWNTRSPARSTTPSPGGMEVKVETKEVSPILQSQLEAEGIYLLDAYGELYVLLGSLFASIPEHARNAVLGQTLLFASDYAILAASMEDRPSVPKCSVLFSGVPRDVKMIFRHWDDGWGLWGTAGLMAGVANSGGEVTTMALDDVLNEVCRE